MKLLQSWKDASGRFKGKEIALLLIGIGIAGSMFFSSGNSLFASETTVTAPSIQTDSLETRLSQALSSMEGAGRVEVVIFYQRTQAVASAWYETPSVTQEMPSGALVIAEGANDIMVRLRLAQAMETLLGLSSDSVEVFAMEMGRGGANGQAP